MRQDRLTSDASGSPKLLGGFAKTLACIFGILLFVGLMSGGAYLLRRANMAAEEQKESAKVAKARDDLRRSGARSMGRGIEEPDPQSETNSSQPTRPKARWTELQSAPSISKNGSGFDSNVAISRAGNFLSYRVVIGPYDPDLEPRLKMSRGWVMLTLQQSSGNPIPSLGQGIKIKISSFDVLRLHDSPVGWSHTGNVRLGEGDENLPQRFSLGWVLPEGLRPRVPEKTRIDASGPGFLDQDFAPSLD